MKKTLLTILLLLAVAIAAIALAHFFQARDGVSQSDSQPVISLQNGVEQPAPAPSESSQEPELHYIEITDGCNWDFSGECVVARSGPGKNYPVSMRLRIGIVLEVAQQTTEADGYTWYKVVFDDEDVRYPERIGGNWYIAQTDAVSEFKDPGPQESQPGQAVSTQKYIVIKLAEQKLYAYDGDTLFLEEDVSTGVEPTVTAPGTFHIYKKTPSRYMQGPLPGISDEYYDLVGTPWDMYFTVDGAAIHGAYWHNNFGHPMSHGCINQPPENAKKLYYWADLGTPVYVEP